MHECCNNEDMFIPVHYALLQCGVECSPLSVYRHSPVDPPAYPACEHNSKTLKCRTLTMKDVQDFHSNFYSSLNKIYQDSFILKNVSVNSPKRHCVSGKGNNKGKYQVFCEVIQSRQISSLDRVQRIARNHLRTGQMPCEKCGGARIQHRYVEQRKSLRRSVESLKCTETHYCRGKSLCKHYLPGDMSISKLYRMYNTKATSSSQNIIAREYNLGFGSPVTNACSKCISLQERVKCETDMTKKNELLIELKVHKLRAKAFYSILKEEPPGVIQFSLDCQKNLVNPKHITPGSFTPITSPSFRDLLNHIYVRIKKGEGQNRNSAIITMVCYFLSKVAPRNVKHIEVIFPVRGHSSLPSDRVFGNIEKIPVICNRTQYHNVFQKFGKVVQLGEDCAEKNWKEYAHQVLKLPASWHFKLASVKRFIIEKASSGMIIRGERFADCAPELVPRGVVLNRAKVTDIKTLLASHFGNKWAEDGR
ncbi:hypothetical protein PR048_017947 [Dryococelus australis]|uniref:Uncharacterized protein n=1 Tax=Dryococelus australis TaxID=614101 RepID=A0ABQ9HB98_9NEOP|nr:hypothetical protein PR048_017947 [Dryococelus australis]